MMKNKSLKIGSIILLLSVKIFTMPAAAQKPSKAADKKIVYQPDSASLAQHQLPQWYQDAKLGIFIHWGLYSVPAWAKGTKKSLATILKEGTGEEWFANNPYAEWYCNSLRIKGSSTEKHHAETYGSNFTYFDFVPQFNQAISQWKADEMAQLFKEIGAKYVVLTTKHHDGFLMWPGKTINPFIKNYQASRDITGELTAAVRKQNMRMGLYYSSGLDWTFNTQTITDFPALFKAIPQQKEYAAYIDSHWHELIEKYKPSVLWADIGSPVAYNPVPMLADYYNAVPDGVVNDRHKFTVTATGFGTTIPHDITTPEYQVLDTITQKKWETCRGIGLSFGYNQTEDINEFLSVNDLIDGFVDIVSKNGNLLLNVGPKADGSIPEGQLLRLRGLGDWLKINGEAIYSSRPFTISSAKTASGGRVRFTKKGTALYLFLLDEPEGDNVTIKDFKIEKGKKIILLDGKIPVTYTPDGAGVQIKLPAKRNPSAAYVFKII
jgi:alpha-L-fucosidase